MKTRQIMKTHVIHTTSDSTLAQAVDLMDLYQVRVLPVIAEDSRICGMIAETDVLRAFRVLMDDRDVESVDRIAFPISEVGALVSSLSVADYMTVPAPTISEDHEVDASSLLLFSDTECAFVVDADGHVVGTVSRIELYQSAFEGAI